jgi:hypothetical protein
MSESRKESELYGYGSTSKEMEYTSQGLTQDECEKLAKILKGFPIKIEPKEVAHAYFIEGSKDKRILIQPGKSGYIKKILTTPRGTETMPKLVSYESDDHKIEEYSDEIRSMYGRICLMHDGILFEIILRREGPGKLRYF